MSFFYKLQMLRYDRIDVSEGTDLIKKSEPKERINCYY